MGRVKSIYKGIREAGRSRLTSLIIILKMDFLFGSIAKLTTPRPPPAAHSGGGPPRPHFDLMEAIRHFSDKRIIITGCTGAVGSIVATRLI